MNKTNVKVTRIEVTKEKPKKQTRLGKFASGFNPRNIKGLVVLFACVFGAIALIAVPLAVGNPVHGGGLPNTCEQQPPSERPDDITLPPETTLRFMLTPDVVMQVGETIGNALRVDNLGAIVSYSVYCLFTQEPTDIVTISLSPSFRIHGASSGFALLRVSANVLQLDGSVVLETQTAQVTVADIWCWGGIFDVG